jgi:hypothetical protein
MRNKKLTVVPTVEAIDRQDVQGDCDVVNNLVERVMASHPELTESDAYLRVKRNVEKICVMHWDLMRSNGSASN